MSTQATQPVWVSRPGTPIDKDSLNVLQEHFGNRLIIARGTSGEVVIAAQPQDRAQLATVMLRSSPSVFTSQKISAN